MTCAAPTTYTKCDTKSAVRNWPAVPGGICIGMYFRNGFSPKTTKIRPSKIRAINTAIFIFGSSPNQSMHEGAGTLHALAPHSMSNERLLWKSVLKPICPRTALGLSRPAADASREVVERWLLDGLGVSVGHRRCSCDPSSQNNAGGTPAS